MAAAHASFRPSRFPAVLFDFDGTLTHPDALDFPALRSAIGCPPGTLILEYIEALPTEDERARKRKVLGDFEMAAARASVPNDGAEQMIHALKSRGVRIGILTSRPEGIQTLVDRAAAAGIRAFLNFVPKRVVAPEGCFVEHMDISAKLEKLSFLSQREGE